MAVNKKKRLAYFENCSNKNLGINVKMLYFAVETWLLTYLLDEFAGGYSNVLFVVLGLMDLVPHVQSRT